MLCKAARSIQYVLTQYKFAIYDVMVNLHCEQGFSTENFVSREWKPESAFMYELNADLAFYRMYLKNEKKKPG